MRPMGRMSRALRAIAPGLLVALPAAAPVFDASVRASWATLGRDQGIFQFIAWSLTQGSVAYRDVRDVNGPLVPLLHRVALALGGGNEHRFRVLDLVMTALAALFAGGCLAALEDRDAGLERGQRVLRALALAAASWAVLSAQYLAYGFWDTAQRESFFDWFVLASVGLQMVAQSRLAGDDAAGSRRSRRVCASLLLASGAASAIPWLGKPTFALFTIGQLAALAVDDVAMPRLRRLALFTVGGALGLAVPFLYLVLEGDVLAWARISFVDVPAMYRFIWPRPFREILAMPGYDATAACAVAAGAVVVALVVAKRMPRRALSLVVMPFAGLGSVAIQAKGFPYHFHPVSAGTALVLVALVHHAWTRAERSGRVAAYGAAGALGLALGIRACVAASHAPYPPVPRGLDPEGEVALAPYDRVDFFPRALRDAAAYLAANTSASETVQLYGMDPYLLFLARRRSATPYIYAYDLDADAALAGGAGPDALRPTEAQAGVIAAMRDEHERDMLERMEERPPAAIVLMDRSPLMRFEEAERDFATHCPKSHAWMRSKYVESASFEGVHVFLRIRGVVTRP